MPGHFLSWGGGGDTHSAPQEPTPPTSSAHPSHPTPVHPSVRLVLTARLSPTPLEPGLP